MGRLFNMPLKNALLTTSRESNRLRRLDEGTRHRAARSQHAALAQADHALERAGRRTEDLITGPFDAVATIQADDFSP